MTEEMTAEGRNEERFRYKKVPQPVWDFQPGKTINSIGELWDNIKRGDRIYFFNHLHRPRWYLHRTLYELAYYTKNHHLRVAEKKDKST